MLDHLLKSFLLFLPAVALSLYVGQQAVNARMTTKQVLGYGLALGAALATLKAIPGPTGLHVPLFAILFFLAFKRIANVSWAMSLAVTLGLQLVGAVGEILVVVPVLVYFDVPMSKTFTDPLLGIAAGWLSNVFLMLLAAFFLLRSITRARTYR